MTDHRPDPAPGRPRHRHGRARRPVAGLGVVTGALALVCALLAAVLVGELVAGPRPWPAVALVLALVLALAVLAAVVVGVVRPVRSLTRTAYDAADRTLPEALRHIRRSSPQEAPPRLPAVEVDAGRELTDLAAAVGAVQSSAVQLAVEQRRAERDAAEMLVNLGRRNQNLLRRTLAYISELESEESDPKTLARLYRLDHATTRIRRNAESMLVLAGAEQTRTWSRPVPLAEVVRAAMSEIEDYSRVDPHHLDDAALAGAAVADVVHLIAELAENATHFSPPESRVVVTGRRVPEGYRLSIRDRGVGMTGPEVEAANARIARAVDGPTDNRLLGLYVVGRLAARRGIAVSLEPSADVGITASVTLPGRLLVDQPAPAVVPDPEPAFGPLVALPTRTEPRVAEPRPEPATSAVAEATPSGIPRRVRGAQLPDLGGTGRDLAVPDPDQVRRQLAALHRGVGRAHTEQRAEP